MIDVLCPQCGAVYHSDELHIGRHLRCARCGSLVPILDAPRVIAQTPPASPPFRTQSQHPQARTKRKSQLTYVVAAAVGMVVLTVGVGSTVHFWNQPAARQIRSASVSDIDNSAAAQQQTTDSQQGNSPELKIVGEEPIPTPDMYRPKPKQLADPRPTNYNSLPTGTRIAPDFGTDGHGVLTVENGTNDDAVVRLYDAATYQTVRWFSVQAGRSARMTAISEGTYILAYTTGLNWVDAEDAFSWHPSYSKFERILQYQEQSDSGDIQYHDISVTLHPVIGGNVRAQRISREEFLKGHQHTPLQR